MKSEEIAAFVGRYMDDSRAAFKAQRTKSVTARRTVLIRLLVAVLGATTKDPEEFSDALEETVQRNYEAGADRMKKHNEWLKSNMSEDNK